MSFGLKITILGCGSSGGVPRLGGADGAGEWGACDPANPKNRRRRCSILVARGTTQVLVDTSPDMREQLLAARVSRLDGVLMTHDHADQVHGLDDLRMLAQNMMRRIDLYAAAEAMAALKARFGYCFKGSEVGGYPAILEDHLIERPFGDFKIREIPVRAFDQDHGTMVSQGFRFGPVAYSSDVVDLDGAAFTALEGVECWIVDALRHRPHPTHAHVEKTLGWIARVKPRRAILTNLHTDLDFEELRRTVPKGVEPAFDGLVIEA